MNAVVAAVSAGALALAAFFVGLFALLTGHSRTRHRAEALQQSDPRLAQELRDVQAGMDRGRSAHVFY